MAFFNRILKNIKRQYWRSILIVAILSVVVVLSTISYSISSSADANIRGALKELGNKVDIMQNPDSYATNSVKPITKDIVNKISDSNYIEGTSYEVSDQFEAVLPSLKDFSTQYNKMRDQNGNEVEAKFNMSIIANSDATYEEGVFKKRVGDIVEGRFYNNDDIKENKNVIVISKELADKNNLHVGDSFEIKYNLPGITEKEASKKVIIIGLYNPYKAQRAGSYELGFTPASFVESMMTEAKKQGGITLSKVYFFLKDPLQRNDFIKEAYTKVDKDTYTLDSSDFLYDILTAPFEKIKSFSVISRNMIIGAGALIMLIVLFILTKERKKEIGILRALGIKKSKIISQLLCEAILLAILSIGIGSAISSITTSKIASNMIQNQVEKAKESSENLQFGIDFSDEIKVTEEHTPSLSSEDIAAIGIITIIITVIGSLSSVYIITKNEPMDILRKGN